MAVQKNKKSRAKRDSRRAHDRLKKHPTLSVDQTTGEEHIRHHITANGFYNGKQILKTSSSEE